MAKNNLRKLSAQEVYDNIDDYGVLSLGSATSGIPKDTQFIAKILEPVDIQFVEQLNGNVCKFSVELKDKDIEPIQFKVRVSESAVNRMLEKYPNEEYVGKRAFFSKASWKTRLVHHVNIIMKDSEFQGKPELVLKAKPEPAKEVPAEKVDPVTEVVTSPKPTEVVDHSLPEEKQPELPVELNEWAVQFDSIPEQFKDSFCQDGNYPKTFVDWVTDATACGTDYFSKLEGEDLRAEATKVYFAMCHRLGL